MDVFYFMATVYLLVVTTISMTGCTDTGRQLNSTTTSFVNPRSNGASARDRDNKLMSLLAARRHALVRDRWRPIRVLQTPPQNSNNITIRKFYLNSSDRNNNSNRYRFDSHNDGIDTIQEINSIINRDELLEMDESSHVVVVNSKSNSKYPTNMQSTKDNNNHNNVVTVEELKPEFKFLPAVTTTTNIPGRNQTKIGFTPYVRSTPWKSRQKIITTSEKSVEETDLQPYIYFGQKLTTVKSSDPRNQIFSTKRTPNRPEQKDKTKDEMFESVDMLVSRPTSTEKTKLWNNRINLPNRNIVAFTNAQRRAQSNLVQQTKIETIAPTTLRPTTYSPLIKIVPTLIYPTTTQKFKIPNLGSRFGDFDEIFQTTSPDVIDPKLMNTRSTINITEKDDDKRMLLPLEINHTLSQLQEESKLIEKSRLEQPAIAEIFNFSESTLIESTEKNPILIINVPDANEQDPMSIEVGSKLSDRWIPEQSPQDILIPLVSFNDTSSMETDMIDGRQNIVESTTVMQDDVTDSRIFLPVPDINHLFPNINTNNNVTINTTLRTLLSSTTSTHKVYSTTQSTETVSQSSSLTPRFKSITTAKTTITTPIPTTSTLKTTIISNPSSTKTTTVSSSTTTSSTTSLPELTTTTSLTFIIATTTNPITSTTHRPQNNTITTDQTIINSLFNLSSIFPNPQMPILPNFTLLPTSDTITSTTSIKSMVAFDGMMLNNKSSSNNNNDVTIEMNRMNMATYVLAGLGMFPIVIILLYVIKTLILKKQSKVTDDLERYIQEGQPISPVVRLEQSDTSSTTDESIMTDRDFNRNKLHFKSILGEGNFGQVWKAEVDDLTGHHGTTRIVAVKAERSGNRQEGLKEEAEIMRKLGSHSNVVTLLGACIEQEPHLLIMEFAMRGKLLSLLRAARSTVTNMASGGQNPRNIINPLAPRQLAGFSHDIARGMEYIAEKKIVHRDLAARNVLLDHNGVCKICDFGMSIDLEKSKSTQPQTRKADFVRRQGSPESRFRFEESRIGLEKCKVGTVGRSRPALPIRWMAPEALQYHIFSIETDIWAFGIVMWEIVTLGCTPYPTLSGREVVRNVAHGTRPEIPVNCRPELSDLMGRTWRKDPRHRPTFTESRLELARYLRLWEDEDCTSDYLDVSGFSEDVEHGMVYLNRRISAEFECEI